MTKRMLIDSTHAEETRVVVLDGNRLEDFDVETSSKKQLKGNIYLAKIVRVEPSLQAAFVEYGGGRHGFLAFGEIHPDYYQIPVADRQRLLEMQEAEARAEEEAEDEAAAAEEAGEEPALPMEEPSQAGSLAAAVSQDFVIAREEAEDEAGEADPSAEPAFGEDAGAPVMDAGEAEPAPAEAAEGELFPAELTHEGTQADDEPGSVEPAAVASAETAVPDTDEPAASESHAATMAEATGEPDGNEPEMLPPTPPPETLNGATPDHSDDEESPGEGGRGAREPRAPARFMRSYKIQEVIRRRQILLVQVVKEERGTKGASLTTFISLAGRFSVLMPNSPRGGGISRKITSAADRRRLKEVTSELQIPRGMGLIVRTAGAARPKAEIRRDCEYLLELWDSIRETTMQSIAPALIHEEANLIKRSIRDNYSRDVEEVVVDGQAGWRAARDFMRMLMPAHARKVVLWNEPQPLFAKSNVEAQLDAMLQPTVQLRSGGYLVINQTEALVAIDVNSGRSTKERGIEETALKTNLEAADELARQLRLRDLAGLVVVDFIDMESRRNNASVERRLKDALRDDRARIQLGSISHFGLLELSRQRLRPSLAETSFTPCPHCGGTGHLRTTETAALAVLRAVEEEGAKRRSAAITVHVAGSIALYILNHKRVRLAEIEARNGMEVTFAADESLLPPNVRIEKLRALLPGEAPLPVAAPTPVADLDTDQDDLVEEDADSEFEDEAPESEAVATPQARSEGGAEGEARRGRNRRRRGGRRPEGATGSTPDLALAEQPEIGDEIAAPETAAPEAEGAEAAPASTQPAQQDEEGRSRRRGRRGGRRRPRDGSGGESGGEAVAAESEAPASFDMPAPSYVGPTPADPYGGQTFDIFDIMDEAPEPAPVAVEEHRPEVEAAAAEATVPAAVELPPEEPVHAAAAPTEAAAVAEPALPFEDAVPPAEAPPLTNGHAPAEPPAEEAAPAVAAAEEPVSAPLTPPVLVGAAPAAERRKGWWRR